IRDKSFEDLLQSTRIPLKRREFLNAEFNKFQMHYEEKFWTKYALKLNSERTAQELARAAQDTAVEEAKVAYGLAEPTASSSTTPPGSPRQTPLTLADLEPLDNTTPLLEGDEPSVTPEVDVSTNMFGNSEQVTDPVGINNEEREEFHRNVQRSSVAHHLTSEISSTVSAAMSASSLVPSISTSSASPSISSTSVPVHDEPADTSAESEQLLEREREELLRSVDESGHLLCDWKIDDTCTACLFEEYRRTSIKALTAREIKRTDIADIMAIIGVFAPTMPTARMREFFSARQLKVVSEPGLELPDANVDDEKIMKAVRLYLKNKGDEAEVPSIGGNKKVRLMLETLLEYLPLKTDNTVSESTFTVKYVAPIIQAYVDSDGVISDFLSPNTDSITQKQQNLKAYRPDIRAKALERELLWGEVTGPIQARNNAKNLWDTFKLVRYGKAFIIAGNDSAPLVQVIDNHGTYMRLNLKVRGVMLLEEIGTFVIPTRKEMVPALVATLPTLELLKEHLKEVSNGKTSQLKRSWGHQDDKIGKKRLI
ncbi:hypothetical protein BGX27_003276, partial [Mortierella sp. AM989]